MQAELSDTIHVGARPLAVGEWRALWEGFEVQAESLAPMHLLEPGRRLRDEGLFGAGRFVWNVLRDGEARARARAMRRIFWKYETHLAALILVAHKPAASPPAPGSAQTRSTSF